MATSGQVNTNTTYDSYFWVKWSQSGEPDIVNNKTLIAWSCGVYCGHSFYSNAIKMSAFSINGVNVYSGGTYSNYSAGNHTIASGTLWITHAADGTKTFSISSFTGWLYSDHNYSSNGESYSLEKIARQAVITEASDFNDTANPSISYSNPGGFPISVWLEPNPVGDHLCERTVTDNTGKFTWNLSDKERDDLRAKCAGTSCTIRIGLYTKIGNTTYADYKDKKYTVTENDATKPSVKVDVSLNNGSLPDPDQFNGLYIQGKSRVKVTMTVSPAPGAKTTSYSAKVDGKMYYNALEFTSDAIQSSGAVDVVGYAADSRGFSGSTSVPITVIAYSKPLVVPLDGQNAVLCYRSDEHGNLKGTSERVMVKAKMSYYDVSGNNSCALQYRRKLSTEAWNDSKHPWKNLAYTANQFNALLPDETFDAMQSYTIQVRAIDDIGEQDIKTFEVPTRDVALHLGRGGKNVSIGSYCDYAKDYTFHCEWEAIFDKGIVIRDETLGDKTLAEYIRYVINEGG